MDSLNPVVALEKAGISNYHVDYNTRTVYLQLEDLFKVTYDSKFFKCVDWTFKWEEVADGIL